MGTHRGGTRVGSSTPITVANLQTTIAGWNSDTASLIPLSSPNFTATNVKAALDELHAKCQ